MLPQVAKNSVLTIKFNGLTSIIIHLKKVFIIQELPLKTYIMRFKGKQMGFHYIRLEFKPKFEFKKMFFANFQTNRKVKRMQHKFSLLI
jgi:hypothetical protein